LEWILAIHLSSDTSHTIKVIPIVFGSYSLAVVDLGEKSLNKMNIKAMNGIYEAHSFSVKVPRRIETIDYKDVDIVNVFRQEKKDYT
jgi:hypothetical protein